MQFSSNEDIEAPIGDVFAMLSEFEAFERSAIRRGIEVQNAGGGPVPKVGMSWRVKFTMRGKRRDMQLRLESYDPPHMMKFAAESRGMSGHLTVELVAHSQRRTRMSVVLNFAPKTLSARLLVQSLRLAKSNLSKRFKTRVADYAKNLEERHQRTA